MESNTQAMEGAEVVSPIEEIAANGVGTGLVVASSADLERAADPGEYVVQACERAKAWLSNALEHGDIEQIVELKSQAEAIRIYTMQKQLGKDAELSAAEIVRRAERGLGVAIRRGQAAGEISNKETGAANRVAKQSGNTTLLKPRPTDFAAAHELSSNGAGIYHMTDGVSDEEFEQAIEAARTESNLSRANVVRKTREAKVQLSPVDRLRRTREMAAGGYSSRQIAKQLGLSEYRVKEIAREARFEIPADAVINGTRRHDSNRIVRETIHALEGLTMGVDLVDFDDLDTSEIENWTTSLAHSIRALNRFTRKMKEMVQ